MRPKDRRPRAKRWADALEELRAPAGRVRGLARRPPRADSWTAELLEGVCDVALDALDSRAASGGSAATEDSPVPGALPDVKAKSRFGVTMNLELAEDEIQAIKTEIRKTLEGWLAQPGRHRHRGDGALRPLSQTVEGGGESGGCSG